MTTPHIRFSDVSLYSTLAGKTNFHWKKIDLVVGACFGSLIVCPLQNKDDPVCPDADHAAVVDVVVFDDVVDVDDVVVVVVVVVVDDVVVDAV